MTPTPRRAAAAGPVPAARPWLAIAVAAALLAPGSGCVTQVVDDPEPAAAPRSAIPLMIALGDPAGDDAPVDQYYHSAIWQMREALVEEDAARLESLLQIHGHPMAPAWARESMEQFTTAALGLRVQQYLGEVLDVGLLAAPQLGEPIQVAIRLHGDSAADRVPAAALSPAVPLTTADVALAPAGAPEPSRFLVDWTVVDHDAFGGRSRRHSSALLSFDEAKPLDRADALPFVIDLPVEGAAVRELRIEVSLLPGRLATRGLLLPHGRVRLAALERSIHPPGVEAIEANPYTTLRNALRLGDEAHLRHVYLAARFMPAAFHDDALRLLMDRIRLGRPQLARVAMVAAEEISGAGLPIGDREAWLRWWQQRVARGVGGSAPAGEGR